MGKPFKVSLRITDSIGFCLGETKILDIREMWTLDCSVSCIKQKGSLAKKMQ